MKERGAIEILEEAVSLLRAAPSAAIAAYLAGAVPFSLGILFFWTDMARSPFAFERLPWESLGMAGLLVWKSVWQAIFEALLYRQISLSQPRSMKIARLAAMQCALQPFSLLAIPVSLLVLIPFAWTVAFFRNAGLFAALGVAEPMAAARRQAGLWSRQNWCLLSVTSLAALLLFANVLISLLLLPQLGRSFLGIEGNFARLGIGLLNPTTVALAASITWLLTDPLLDAVYVLRCFHGESLATGEDLRVALQRAGGAIALTLLLFAAAPLARAQVPTPPPGDISVRTIDPQLLHRSIDRVIRRREFAWRSPRPPGPEPNGRWVGWVRSALDTVGRAADWMFAKLRQWFQLKPDAGLKQPPTERPPIEILMAVAALALAGSAVALFLRRGRSLSMKTDPAATASVAVDLSDESITADQMAESTWLQLAGEWLAKGDCRLALRALYLAGLKYLGERDLISIRRWKTGLDYRRELERRMRARPLIDPLVTPVFARGVALFERGWYGRHPVERADVEAFALGLEEMKRYAGRS